MSQQPTVASDAPPDLPRSEFRVRCNVCGHRWVAAYLPMEIRKFVVREAA